MKNFSLTQILLVALAFLLPPCMSLAASDNNATGTGEQLPATPLASVSLVHGSEVALSVTPLFSLSAETGSLLHEMTVTASVPHYKAVALMPSALTNVTGSEEMPMTALRLLPSGEHFSEPAELALAYDPTLLPQGTTANDIYTFFYDSLDGRWVRLERVRVDTVRHLVVSLTTHFTDFANAVISVPELPQTSAFVPTAMTDIPDPDPLEGIPMVTVDGMSSFGSPTGDNSGSASLTYPIVIPPGRHGLQPDVSLHYNSDNGNGILGVGWSIPTPAVTIDTRWGVPRYSPMEETEAYLVNGEQVVMTDKYGDAVPLPHQDTVFRMRDFQTKRFRFRDMRNASRVIRHGQTPQTYWWEVNTTSGVTYYYGRMFDPEDSSKDYIDENSVLRTADGNIGYWALTAIVDLYGNYVKYYNSNTAVIGGPLQPHPDGDNIYLDSICYTGNYNTNLQPTYTVSFYWNPSRNDDFSDARLGVMRKVDKLLCNLSIHYKGGILARYFLNYESNAQSLWKSRLASIKKSDIDGNYHISDCGYYEDIPEAEKIDPGSLTTFHYNDAPTATFGSIQPLYDSQIGINTNISAGWDIGGNATVGLGMNVAQSSFSAGGHYNFGMNDGQIQSMLIDMNGDGLPDLVYKDGDSIMYRRQRIDNTGFHNPVRISGLERLSRDVSRTHDWGLQLSFGLCLGYSNPITISYTDYFFTDINADGLPDMVTPNGVLFNFLDSVGNPSYTPFTADYVDVQQHNSNCSGIKYTGQVDEHITCQLIPYAVATMPLDSFLPDDNGLEWIDTDTFQMEEPNSEGILTADNWAPLPIENKEGHLFDGFDKKQRTDNTNTQIGHNTSTLQAEPRLTSNIPDSLVRVTNCLKHIVDSSRADFFESDCFYRIENGNIVKYRYEYVCHTEELDQKIETVRVWVAHDAGTATINSSIRLLNDTSFSFEQSKTANGIQYIIQINRQNSTDSIHFSSTTPSILTSGNISKVDHNFHNITLPNISISTGDIVLFRLLSNDNSLYDDVEWQQHISLQGANYSTQTYSSNSDYICTGSRYFTAPVEGDAIVRYSYINDTPHNLQMVFNGCLNGPVTLTSNSSSTGYVYYDTLHVEEGDNIACVVSHTGSIEPQWNDIHVYPQILFTSKYPVDSTSNDSVCGTTTFYPDVKYQCSSLDLDTVYKLLFGPLHKGWGQFAYNRSSEDYASNHVLDITKLYNTEYIAMQNIQQGSAAALVMPNIQSSSDLNSTTLSEIDSIISFHSLYNPLSTSNCWIPMYPDSKTERWISYGNIGYISSTQQSNSRIIELDAVANETGLNSYDTDIPYYDSPIPNNISNVKRITFIRKSSKSVNHNLTGGPDILSFSHSWGKYDVETDFIDLNGDGFPDIVGSSAVQYTMPWGGLGHIVNAEIECSRSVTEGEGINFSGTIAVMERITRNSISKGPFSIEGNGGPWSENQGTTETERSFIDINGDGLPDIVSVKDNTVRYNLGYSFTPPAPLYTNSIFINRGSSVSVSANSTDHQPPCWGNNIPNIGFSLQQYSISGGLSGSFSENMSNMSMADVNGDGLPDMIRTIGGNMQVAYNRGSDFATFVPLFLNGNIQQSTSENINGNIAYTCGFAFMGVKGCGGIHISGGGSESRTDNEFIDINGDGCPDYVTYSCGNNLNVRYGQFARVNLLNKVTNPTGHEYQIEYSLSEPSATHKGRKWLVKLILDIDSLNPWQEKKFVWTVCNFSDPYYDNNERTDYGFAEQTIEESGLRRTKELFHNTSFQLKNHKQGDILLDTSDSSPFPLIGHRYEVSHKDNQGYDAHSLCDAANTHVYCERIMTDYYEGESSPRITTAANSFYDNKYNLTGYLDEGDTAVVGDEWKRNVTYLNTQYHNLVSLPISDTITDMSDHPLRVRKAVWTTKGSLSHVISEDAISGQQAMTTMQYDPYGNVIWYALPANDNGERVNYNIFYEYDTHTYPYRIFNQFNETLLYQYDPRIGKPLLTVDPSGQEIDYEYDFLGRLTRVLAPNEWHAAQNGWWTNQHKQPYTIRYTYNNIHYNHAPNAEVPPNAYTYVLKEMLAAPDTIPVTESAIYSARGEPVQHKKITEINGSTEIVTDGVHAQDALGRVVFTLYPSISTSHMWKYDDSSNSTGAYKTIYRYDALDRNVKTILPDLSEINIRYHFATDSTGALRLMTRQTDQLGNVTFTLSSPQGWTTQQTLADGSSTLFGYNCIGELQRVIDADGYTTYYEYDLFGRRTRRIHPDANVTEWTYDPAGNIIFSATQRQKDAGQKTEYYYCFNRLMSTVPSGHPWDSARYNYDTAGRLAWREDVTGSERLWYDALGNIRQTCRRVILPSEESTYQFMLLKEFDSFGKMRRLTYPDGECVNYYYNIDGNLLHVASNSRTYIDSIQYDELGHVIKKAYGNNTRSLYGYDRDRQWLDNLYTEKLSTGGNIYQDIDYYHDYAGNITYIQQNANTVSGMGGQYDNEYIYDHRYRLVQNLHTDGYTGPSAYLFEYSPTTRMGRKKNPDFQYDLWYGYDKYFQTHQIRTIFDNVSHETMQLYWDRDGNLCQTQMHHVPPRFHIWNDDDKMLLAVGPTMSGLYGYSAAGDRPYKITGPCNVSSLNGGVLTYEIYFDNAVLYPNPYITVTPNGYFKHYFAGTERIATAEGDTGLENWLIPPQDGT